MAQEYQEYTEAIRGEKEILNTLQSLIDHQIVCTMEIPRTQHSWITMLLGIQHAGDSYYLLIDRVSGFENAQSHYADRGVSLEFREEGGVPCQFQTNIIACRPKDILSEIPKVIHRVQRRQYFRLEARLGTEITFRIGSSNPEEKAKVKDYSAGGVAFFIEKGQKLSVGDLLSDIHLNIPKKTGWIRFHIPQAVVRRMEEYTSYGGRDNCAIEFLEIPNETRNSIISVILNEQRVTIQRVRR